MASVNERDDTEALLLELDAQRASFQALVDKHHPPRPCLCEWCANGDECDGDFNRFDAQNAWDRRHSKGPSC